MITLLIIVGLTIIVLLTFYIGFLNFKFDAEYSISSYFASFYNEVYKIYDDYVKANNQEDKAKAVTSLLNLCKQQRECQAKLEEKLNINK